MATLVEVNAQMIAQKQRAKATGAEDAAAVHQQRQQQQNAKVAGGTLLKAPGAAGCVDRTTSEDEKSEKQHQPQRQPTAAVAAEMLKVAADKAGGRAPQQESGGLLAAASPMEVVQESGHRSKAAKSPRSVDKCAGSVKSGKDKSGKTKRAAAGKKLAAKTERASRRRKRKSDTDAERSSKGISQASANMLFRCSCQLLCSQALDYDIRAREMEERNAAQAKEVEQWKKRIRGLKHELQEYGEGLLSHNEAEVASTALAHVEGKTDVELSGLAEEKRPVSSVESTASTASENGSTARVVDPSLPPRVAAAEAQLQDELRKRTQKANEFVKSVPGFITTLDEQQPRRR